MQILQHRMPEKCFSIALCALFTALVLVIVLQQQFLGLWTPDQYSPDALARLPTGTEGLFKRVQVIRS